MNEEPNTVDAALEAAGEQYRADAAKAARPAARAVAELHAEAAAKDADAGKLADITNEQLAGLIVGIAVLFLPKLDKRLVYSDAEQTQIAQAAVPVLNKYFPDGGLPCELVLLGTVAVITAPKFLSAGSAAEAGGAEAKAAEPAERQAA